MIGRLPDFVIIGAMKCGTSTLHEQLSRRPGLCMSRPKEPNFFSDDAEWSKGLDAYRALFAQAKPEQRCGESSTHYTKLPTYPNCVARMHDHVPDVKLIYLMRDPMARIASQYLHEWSMREVRGSFGSAVKNHERFAAYSCYARQLEPYVKRWGRDRILLLATERMRAHPDEVLAEVCAFIGDPSETPARWDTSIGAQNVSTERMRKSAARDAVLGLPLISSLKRAAPAWVKNGVKRLWQKRKRPVLPLAVAAEVRARVDKDLAQIGQWIGADLSCDTWRAHVKDRPMEWAVLDNATPQRHCAL